EAAVQRAIAVEACQREVGENVDDGRSRRDDLPVRLQGNGKHGAKAARECEIASHGATPAEAGVERAIAVVACRRDVEDVGDDVHRRRENLSVLLYFNGTRRGTAPKIGGHRAPYAEAGVEGAIASSRGSLSGYECWGEPHGERQERERASD